LNTNPAQNGKRILSGPGDQSIFKNVAAIWKNGMERRSFLVLASAFAKATAGQVVSTQSQGFLNLFLRRSLAKTQKILAPNGYDIFSNALAETSEAVAESAALTHTTN
jgi:hypothetical protein